MSIIRRSIIHNWKVYNRKVTFQKSDHMVICAKLWTLDLVSYKLLQVWHVIGLTHLFFWNLKIPKYLDLFLVPDGFKTSAGNSKLLLTSLDIPDNSTVTVSD